MKRLLLALTLLLSLTPAYAADFADTDKMYLWDGAQYYPTMSDLKTDIETDVVTPAISDHAGAADPHTGYALESNLGDSAPLDVGVTGGVASWDDARFPYRYYYPTSAAGLITALSTAGTSGGGVVILPAGEFIGNFDLPANVTLEGKGWGVTTLKGADATDDKVIEMGDYSTIRNLTIDGNKAGQAVDGSNGYGIMAYYKNHPVIDHVEVKNTNNIGIGIHTSINPVLSNLYVHHTRAESDRVGTTGKPGIWLYNSLGASITDTTSEHNGLDGIIIFSDGVTVSGGTYNYNGEGMAAVGAAGVYLGLNHKDIVVKGVQAHYNTGIGIDVPSGNKNITVSNSLAGYNNNAGILFSGVSNSTMSGNVAFNNGQNAQVLWQDAGVVVKDGSYNSITGNITYDDQTPKTQYYGFNFDGTLSNSKAVGNVAHDNANTDYYTTDLTGTGNELYLTASSLDAGDTLQIARLGLGQAADATIPLAITGSGIKINATSGSPSIDLQQVGTSNGTIKAVNGAGNDIQIDGARLLTLGKSGTGHSSFSDKALRIGKTGFTTASNQLEVVSDTTNAFSSVYTAGSANSPYFLFRRAGGTVASPTAVLSGYLLGSFILAPRNDTAFITSLLMEATASQNWDADSTGYDIDFYTRANDSGVGAATSRMRIGQDGLITHVGATDFQGNLTVDGSDTITDDTAASTTWANVIAASTTANITLGAIAAAGAETWTLPDISADKQSYIYRATRSTTATDTLTVTCHSSDSGTIVYYGGSQIFNDSITFGTPIVVPKASKIDCTSKLSTNEWFCSVAGM